MPYIETKARYENTTMREIRNDSGDLTGYDIAPMDGYVLHNSVLDAYKYDPKTEEQGELISYCYSPSSCSVEPEYDPKTKEQGELISHGYSPSSCSVEPNYDFKENPYAIYAVKRDAIGDDGIIY